MDLKIREIADRLRGFRDALDLSEDSCAAACGISVEQYNDYEAGNTDIPVSFLYRFSTTFDIEITALLTGDMPRMAGYSLTRKGTGVVAERRKEYKYQALNESFIHKKAQPFVVTVSPDSEPKPIAVYQHQGQEFNLVLKGRLMVVLNGKELVMEEGDSLWFNSGLPHGMKALDGQEAEFLAMIF
ncbi:helix-turn-helix domain-containing protein [Gaoshiqia sediminis]|uniref:XRE family transcriptional regulator n=1 Tax=Gaoshiqia sediminis TaxID=2986998 RepID=A0AA41Y774_9BACT|nr:XRE family transcriptional regulator [Gaoshiqia sediminis]MCW0482741.1 XRE family transcriptional regulator [Gaoshiqia sediminis]